MMWQYTILYHYTSTEYVLTVVNQILDSGICSALYTLQTVRVHSTSTHEYVLTFSRRYREAEAGLRDVGAALHRSVDVM